MNKKLIFVLGSAVLIVVFAVFVYLANFRTPDNKIETKPRPVPTDFNIDYSKIKYLRPGNSTLKDVNQLLGVAYSTKISSGKTYLYYKTPGVDYQNVVVVENNVVLYTLENVFGGYRGNYSNYVNMYGQPSIHLYTKGANPYDWFVFLNKGVAIETSNDIISAIIYFVPQSKEAFLNSIAKENDMVSEVNKNPYPPGVY